MYKAKCKECPNLLRYHSQWYCNAHNARRPIKSALATCMGQHREEKSPCRRCQMSQYEKKDNGTIGLKCFALHVWLDYNEEIGSCGHWKPYFDRDIYGDD